MQDYRLVVPGVQAGPNYDRKKGVMCWLCDHPGATLDDYYDALHEKIRKQRLDGAVRRK